MTLYITPGGRVYDSSIGRFLQKDPLAPPGTNPYVYANNDPLTHVDPSGAVNTPVGPIALPMGLPEYFDDAGRYIFSLWCTGQGAKQGTVVIANWGNYMMLDPTLKDQVRDLITEDAKERTSNGSWSYKGAGELAEDNWWTGRGMLHGADEDVGGFQISGYAQVTELADECKKITYFNQFDWYDQINPNLDNKGDAFLVRVLKKICTKAADYKIRVHWKGDCTIVIDAAGNIKEEESEGWPFEFEGADPSDPSTPSTPGVPCDPWCNVG